MTHVLRRFWLLPLLGAILGALAGGYAGSVAQPSAVTLVRVQSPAEDGTGMTVAVTTAARELDNASTFDAAAKGLTDSGPDLRKRTQIAAVPDSQVMSITVTAPEPEQAVQEADAIVRVGIQQGTERRDAELTAVTTATRALVTGQKLADADAERARVAGLGDALAASQSNLIANARQLTLLSQATVTSNAASPALLTALGAAGGALVGLAIALVLGLRRGRVKSAKELRRLYPHMPVLEQDELASLASMEAFTTATWVVGGFEQSTDRLQSVIDDLSGHLSAAGLQVELSDSLAVLRERRGTRRAASDGVSIVATPLNQAIVRSVERDPTASLLLVVQPGHTRYDWLDQYAAIFGDHTYLVVGTSNPNWKW